MGHLVVVVCKTRAEHKGLHKEGCKDIPEASVAVACSGDERRMASDFSAAYSNQTQ